MTGPVTEGAAVAKGVVEGLKSQPLSLALVVLNLVFIVFAGYLAHQINQRTNHQYEVKDALISKLITECKINKDTMLRLGGSP